MNLICSISEGFPARPLRTCAGIIFSPFRDNLRNQRFECVYFILNCHTVTHNAPLTF